MLVRFSMPRSPIRFLSCPMRAFTKPWRSLANLYSAFSERSPWARATAISLGRSMLSSRSSAVISSCSFCLIFFSGSDIVVMFRRRSCALILDTANPNYKGGRIPATSKLSGITKITRLAHFDVDSRRFGVAGGIGDGQRIGGVLFGSDVHAAGIGGPDGTGLRLQFHRFRVGHSVAELRSLPAMDHAGADVETLDGEFFAAKLFQRNTVAFALFARGLLAISRFNPAIFFPAGEQDPAHRQEGHPKNNGRIQQRIFGKAFGRRRWLRRVGQHDFIP